MFFFFKQKTAYEMRISDWSSDVCSSDLHADIAGRKRQQVGLRSAEIPLCQRRFPAPDRLDQEVFARRQIAIRHRQTGRIVGIPAVEGVIRSEEHTSELQSLMRISYADFCLNKTKQLKTTQTTRVIS